MAYEFLPLCDVLFNIISLALYFCDIVFDLVLAYGLIQSGKKIWAYVTVSFVFFSLIICQFVSLRWYWRQFRTKTEVTGGIIKVSFIKKLAALFVVVLHFGQIGVLWRYFKLFTPVDLRYVKYEVRYLCMIRLVHAFCQSAPSLLIQTYLLLTVDWTTREIKDLNLISACLSLLSVCWALASFSKNVRMQNVHKLVLTWLGVIFQLGWRICTVSSRAIALALYASIHTYWTLLVLVLHWISMFLWLLSPDHLFSKEKLSKPRKISLCSIVAYIYILAYINLQEKQHRQKMLTFYLVMAVENALLIASWWVSLNNLHSKVSPNSLVMTHRTILPLIAVLTFVTGIVFMLLYYRYFHVRRLKYESGGRLNNGSAPTTLTITKEGDTVIVNGQNLHNKEDPEKPALFNSKQINKLSSRYRYCSHQHGGIPGVFNCRFANPYGTRKKKKPTSFVPPPSVGRQTVTANGNGVIPNGTSSHHNSYADYREKLEEKKRRQLAELRSIEEEIIHQQNGVYAHDGGYQNIRDESSNSPVLLTPQKYLRDQENGDVSTTALGPYTLPRQTSRNTRRYLGGGRSAMVFRHHESYGHHINSSDGDVDSCDDNDSVECWTTSVPHIPFSRFHRNRVKHETKL